MSRAEERALGRFPAEMTPLNYQELIDAFGGKEVDFNELPRGFFQQGYEQAEKDILDFLKIRHGNYKSILQRPIDPRSREARDLISRMREDSEIIETFKEYKWQ